MSRLHQKISGSKKRGVLCISFDLELLWGRHDLNYLPFVDRVRRERTIMAELLDLLEKYKVPATWAVVGHLFLSSCSPARSVKHPEIARPKYSWLTKDWFASDPAGNLKTDPEWYGSDIVKTLKASPRQEIGSHSFSHIIFGDPGCSAECAESELKACVALAKKQGVDLDSFVFPRNSVGHLDVLRKNGFRSYRGPDPYNFKSKLMSRLFMLLELFSLTPIKVATPSLRQGLVNIPGSMYFVSARGIRKFIPKGLRAARAKSGVDLAIKQKRVFHLWTHPTDFADKTALLMCDFEEILRYATEKRRLGLLEIQTMGEISRKFV